MSTPNKFIELRKAKRHKLNSYLDVFDRETNKAIGKLADVSSHGINLISHEQISSGKKFKLKMIVPKEIINKGSIEFEAKSIWGGHVKFPDCFAIGFKTTSISDKNRKLLTKLIESAEQQEKAVE